MDKYTARELARLLKLPEPTPEQAAAYPWSEAELQFVAQRDCIARFTTSHTHQDPQPRIQRLHSILRGHARHGMCLGEDSLRILSPQCVL